MTLNSIVLIYTSNAIVAESNTDLLILLGKVEKSVQGIAHNARGVGVLAGSSQELVDYSYNQIISYMKVLEETHQNITNNLNEWNTCGGNDAFTNENAPIWENFDGIYIKEANLIDAVSQFINVVTDIQGNIFLDKYNNKQNDAKEVKFINLNGLSQIFNYCNSSLYTFTDCIMNNSKELESWMNILLVVGFANLVICLVITMFFARYSIIAENNLWNKIKKNASKNYEHLKKNYFDRLSEMHGQNNILFSDTKKISEIGNFKNHWKYFWRNSVYFILALAFFLVNYLYLYQNCVEYLHLRPSLLRTIINSQVLYKSLIVWTSEFSISTTPIALPIYLSGVYPFSNELSCLNNVISSLLNSEREIRNKKYSPLLSDKFSEVFYENTRNIAKIGDYGVYTAGALLPFEAYYLDFSGLDNYLEVWFKLVKEINALDSEYDLLVDLADKDSQNAIMQQLRWIAITLGIFIVCSWILYFVFYLPFLLKEQKKLENMTLIAKLIPNKYFK
ncbi:unnamed protein product [Blepharisma stoltei]|uniref:Uncharacterized protein n=1 Tax=Blepharisma stoltei TaxID=1481888 RepID=A0AAU9JFP2_9CILI|nr:unnamed protein product [Blepharisma stoltei]